jgi:DNA-binding transcriptional LysR family regulator
VYSFDQLRGYVAVGEELHFGRAAERLRMTQPPLSRAIQKLERDLGVILLERGTRSVRLTPAGAVFLVEARRMLAAAETAREAARRVSRGVAGAISIGFTATSAVSILPSILRACDRYLPDVSVTLHELVSGAQSDALGVGEIDIGLMRLLPTDPHIHTRLIHSEHLVVAIPVGHPLAAETGPLSVSAFDGMDMIDYNRVGASYFADLVASLLVNVRPRSRQRVTQVHTMLALVGAGRGLAIVPEAATAFHLGGVVIRTLVEADRAVVELYAAWLPSSQNAALHLALDTVPELQPEDKTATDAESE